MYSEDEIVQRLAAEGYRVTKARRAIIRVLMAADDCLTPADVYQRARRYAPRLGLVTAYRTLDVLSQLGVVRRIHAEDGCHGYASIGRGHRHLLTCRRCGRVQEFEGCDLGDLFERVRTETGFSLVDHMLELTGVCPACQQAIDQTGAD